LIRAGLIRVALAGIFMKQAAVGFRVHSGWTALVALTIDEGCPMVLLRSRPHLVNTFTYEFRQPYHSAEKRPAAEAPGVISRARAEARSLAYRAIRSVEANLEEKDYELKRCALILAAGRPLPALPQILASHALIHTADGELFREALIHAGTRCGFAMFTTKEKALFETASHALRLSSEELHDRLDGLGAGLGPPWTQDEKFAALAGWLSLLPEN
jgi:hypothetical protein